MYVLGRVWRRRASEFGPRAKTWASCNVLKIRAIRLAQNLLDPLQAGALTPPLNPPLRGLHKSRASGSFYKQGTRNFCLENQSLGISYNTLVNVAKYPGTAFATISHWPRNHTRVPGRRSFERVAYRNPRFRKQLRPRRNLHGIGFQ
jgi:hypothetical protein